MCQAEGVRADLPGVRLLITTGGPVAGFLNYESLIAQAEPANIRYARTGARAFIIYTSGTTGHAKGVVTNQQEIVSQALGAILPEYGLTAASRLLALYPHGSAASTNCAFGPAWILGATLVVDDVKHFTAERFLANIERYQVTHARCRPCWSVSCGTSRKPASDSTFPACSGSLTARRRSPRR